MTKPSERTGALVPTYHSLSDVYVDEELAVAKQRYKVLQDTFKQRFQAEPQLYARAPGRVNLIGEHIDYEGYAVLPMALKQDTIVAIRAHGDGLVLTNTNATKYPEKSFPLDPDQKVDTQNHSWANYFLAAYKGVFKFLKDKAPQPRGLEVCVSGTVPEGSGLSSSAAIVCSSALAILGSLGLEVGQTEVATFTATCEKYVGTESGGMDQAISIMGQQGIAKLVMFNPVRAEDVVLPEAATFVIANSLTVSAKAETAAERYNMRVVECRLATMMLALGLNMRKEEALELTMLHEVEAMVEQVRTLPKGMALEASCEAVRQHLHEQPYTEQELERALGQPLKILFRDNDSQLQVLQVAKGYKLQQRALHVFQEAARVPAFKNACDGKDSTQDKMAALAGLMNDSQTSCREVYECSCAELDTLISLAMEAGALAGRLTGAGWGGCMVALVPADKADDVIKHLQKQYYADFIKDGRLKEDELGTVVFASKPANGGAILRLS